MASSALAVIPSEQSSLPNQTNENAGFNKALALTSSTTTTYKDAELLHDLWIAGTIGMKVGIEDKRFHHITRGTKAKTSYERFQK